MSTQDDKAEAVSGEAVESCKTCKDDGSGGVVFLFFIIGLMISLVFGWVVFPKILYSGKKQPFDFNHVVHNEVVDDGCESCHFFRDDGTYAGVPKLAQCVDCHEEVQGETEDEAIFVRDYVSKNREVPWLIYSKQPDCVFFSHVAHVKTAGMDCVTCHGDIGESTSLKVYEKNIITGYSRDIWGKNMIGLKKNTYDRMKMDDCAECHVKEGVKQSSVQTKKGACFVCHK
ncbi:cytochrome c3 family protein [Desulfobacterales bacterium HSG16]|nr:cytochrome c3 family protein [Desulfobacterales bacterium HSG16]